MKLNSCNEMKITEDNIAQLIDYWGTEHPKTVSHRK